ncbi:MAG TPA: presenilin family intramembrane aspartyl protease [archaeon]|jgi:presenilin-like A22 family membrane protease|nr:presenilin family intramembrane aspartyl protease [archaeon]HRT02907.1 presenilin family intramembrane aspartyl protease [Candidatus Diapherotrites archaeon]
MQKRKITFKFILYFLLIFIVVQAIGLFVANSYATSGLVTGIFTKDPNNIWNAVGIFLEILLLTAIILFLRKFSKKSGYLVILEFLALFAGLLLFLDIFLVYLLAAIVSLFLVILKYYLSSQKRYLKLSIWYNNCLLAIAIGAAGAIIGLSLGILPVIVFLLLLSLYDIIAVFYTKHMVKLAKIFTKQKVSFLFVIPTKNGAFQLGGGDLVIPLTICASLFFVLIQSFPFKIAILPIIGIWIASIIGLIWTFYAIGKYKLKAVPALPPQAILMLVVIIITFLFL